MSSPAAEGIDQIRARVPLDHGWLVGGSVRDLLLRRPVTDVDIVVAGDPRDAARGLARDLDGSPFPLSERHGAWRVVLPGSTIDVAAVRGSIEEDLGLRDFAVNAMALPMTGGELIDPHGGRADLREGVLRAVSRDVFTDDPLRLLRLARIAYELGFGIDPATAALARSQASLADRPSGERIFMEMTRLLSGERPARALRLAESLGVLDVVVPEIAPLRGVAQSPHHQFDVWEHTLHVVEAVADVADHPEHYVPAHVDRVRRELDTVVGDELTARRALRFSALFHDIAKPQTRRQHEGGRVSFVGHDAAGARVVSEILGRWKASNRLVAFSRIMVAEHLALGFAVPDRPLGRRQAHRYLRATEPWAASSVVLSLADRMATRGSRSRLRHLRKHAETASELLGLIELLEEERGEPLLRGDEIAAATGASGAEIGRLVGELAEEQAAQAVTTREEALEFVREQVRQDR